MNMDKEYLIAYDLGTSGTKASLFTTSGQLVATDTYEYPVYYGANGVAEQDAEDYWKAVVATTRKLTGGIDASHVRALSFSGQMMACLPVDREGKPVRRSIIWADMRSKAEEEILKARLGAEHGYELIGHRISCSYSITKLMWMKAHEPENYQRTYKVLQAKDYIHFKLTGCFVCDYSDGSGTNAMDLRNLCWSQEIFDAAEVDINKMPELLRSIDVVGPITAEAAQALGLPMDVAIVAGGGDGPCATLGAGCLEQGKYYLTFGTSAWIAGTTATPVLDKNQTLFCFAHVIPGCYMPTGTMQAAGSSYAYVKRTFFDDIIAKAEAAGKDVYDLLNEMIEASPRGAKGLLYLPYLTGERSPRWNPLATASFLGMTMNHTREDYLRATIEGVAMNLAVILRAFRENAAIDDLILTGGGAQGDVVTKILADVLGCSMTRTNHPKEATSMAAAVIAGVGAGLYEGFDAIYRFIDLMPSMKPDAQAQKYYEERIRVFDDCYEALKGVYAELRTDKED